MENLASNLLDIFGTVFAVGMLCCLPLIVITGIISSFAVSMKQRKAGEQLAPEMGLTQLNQAEHPLQKWYGGMHKGRAYALQTFVVSTSYYFDGRRRNSYSTHLRIVMDTGMRHPLGVTAARNRKAKHPQSFEEAFTGEALGLLSSPARRALFGFMRKGNPKGITKSWGLRLSRGARSISLFDREGNAEKMLSPEVLPNSKAILIYDHNDAGVSPENLRRYLDEMLEVANAIENDTPARSLIPEEIPEEGWMAKNSAVLLGVFMTFVLPGICCICASTLVALQG